MTKTKKGFVGLIFLVIGVALMLYWFVYLWNNSWYGGKLNLPDNALGGNTAVQENQPSKSVDAQLNDLRQDIKALQDKKDQEILDELNK